MSDSRTALLQTVDTYREDIAVACFLHSQVAPETPTPGDVITWICRMQPAAMTRDLDNLKTLAMQLEYVDAVQVSRLYAPYQPGWSGPAGSAFQERWTNAFLSYVGKDGASGRKAAFTETQRMLRRVAHQTELLQEKCQGYITQHLAGLRQKFIAACQDDAETEKLRDIKASVDLAIGGIKILVSGGNPVEKVGDALGLLVNAVYAFMEATITEAQDALTAEVAGQAFRIADATDDLLASPVIEYQPYVHRETNPYESD